LLRRTDLPTTLARLRPHPAAVGGHALSVQDSARLARAVTRTLGALPGDARCLVTSVVVVAVLARRGGAGSLVIGVRPGSEFGAHAWVERDGVALLPSGPGEFGRLVEL
ncbi:MAG: lasso peptide biosynthesis B2 protein, partial [Acidimicrobiia bacterium]